VHGTRYATTPIINSKSSLINSNAVQLYEYSVYGQVAASDPNHPNPFLFTGRRFDTDTGLYYYRARYYNPYIGRFLQTDPVGYAGGINLYAYCANNPLRLVDPSGREAFSPLTHWYTFEFKLPVDLAIASVSPEHAEGTARNFFAQLEWYSDHPGWGFESAYLEEDGKTINVRFIWHNWLTSEKPEPNIPNMKLYRMGGGTAIIIDGVGYLTARMLNKIIEPDIERVNGWSRLGGTTGLNWWRLVFDCDTAFHKNRFHGWKYYGVEYTSDEINYVLEGHAMHHLMIAPTRGLELVLLWKLGAYQDGPSWGTLLWYSNGYYHYYRRSGPRDWLHLL